MHTYKGLGLRSASPLLILRIVGAPFLFLGKALLCYKKKSSNGPQRLRLGDPGHRGVRACIAAGRPRGHYGRDPRAEGIPSAPGLRGGHGLRAGEGVGGEGAAGQRGPRGLWGPRRLLCAVED